MSSAAFPSFFNPSRRMSSMMTSELSFAGGNATRSASLSSSAPSLGSISA